ncbi:hypothetical protein HPB47_004922 [Ixodes persulcatus]|uniref:Uncharacterized protein n=1 Tax=Ixodes persulcatus TaxID=34615 RepID=A0AC60PEL3_IXOPE|nr:hypothetical protein HPB47_004922 [Ixodes persulcatus]
MPGTAYGRSGETLKQRDAELDIEGFMRLAIAVKKQELQKPQIVILASGHRNFTGNSDSGAKISVVKRSLVPDYQPSGSKIRMRGAYGEQVTADLANLPLRLRDEPQYVTYAYLVLDEVITQATASVYYSVSRVEMLVMLQNVRASETAR